MEYSSELWSPSEVKCQLMLEGVQCRVTRFILNYPANIEYRERLIKLNLLPLDIRRNIKDLLFFFKCRAGLLDIQLPDFVLNRPPLKYNFRSYGVNNISDIKCRTDYLKNSHFPQVIMKWNQLDSNIKSNENFEIKTLQKFYNELKFHGLPHK